MQRLAPGSYTISLSNAGDSQLQASRYHSQLQKSVNARSRCCGAVSYTVAAAGSAAACLHSVCSPLRSVCSPCPGLCEALAVFVSPAWSPQWP